MEHGLKRLNLYSLNRIARAAQAGEEYVAGCTGKKAYWTSEQALAKPRKKGEPRLYAYRCKHCKKFHLTHTRR